MTLEEVAVKLRCGTAKVRKLIRSGVLNGVVPLSERDRRIPADEVERAMARLKGETNEPKGRISRFTRRTKVSSEPGIPRRRRRRNN
jgi:excisionase family DNA binding protein